MRHHVGVERHCDSCGQQRVWKEGWRHWEWGWGGLESNPCLSDKNTHTASGILVQSQVGGERKKNNSVSCKVSVSLIFFIPAVAPSSPNPENTTSQVARRVDVRDNLSVWVCVSFFFPRRLGSELVLLVDVHKHHRLRRKWCWGLARAWTEQQPKGKKCIKFEFFLLLFVRLQVWDP